MSEQITKDSFEYGQVLGEGAFGQVRLCMRTKTKAQYAAKILMKEQLIKAKQVLFLNNKMLIYHYRRNM